MSAELPRCAYRLQLRPGFGFDEAVAVVPYLADLGVSHVYTSPVLEAEPGSEHGYDVVDHSTVRSEFGGEPGLIRFTTALADHGLGWMLDIVPNHMSIASHHNRWWWDVLRKGPDSPHAAAFDIDWEGDPARVVLPILRDDLNRVLRDGAIVLEEDADGAPVLRYRQRLLPLASETAAGGPEIASLLERQHYRLVHWRRGTRERNYRCFFDISDLAGLRMEDPDVFGHTHRLLGSWVETGLLDAIRVDHIDGLADPLGYLHRLRDLAPAAWIVVEKILSGDERLRPTWPVDGTTGYEFARIVNEIYVDRSAASSLTALYEAVTGKSRKWAEVEATAKREVVSGPLAGDVDRVGRRLAAIAAETLPWISLDAPAATAVVGESLSAFDVYRTYVRPQEDPDGEDLLRIEGAMSRVRSQARHLEPELIDLLEEALTGRSRDPLAIELATRFQQLTGPVTAKGLEDRALYRYLRLAALNQVGGEPHRLGLPPWELHRLCAELAHTWPRTLVTASTHDSKRSHDVRARLTLLSECPAQWGEAVGRWMAHNQRHRSGGVPDRNTEYLIYQTLVGAWPLEIERATDYFRKAAREAGEHTSWYFPEAGYEEALLGFVEALLSDQAFVSELEVFIEPLIAPARVTSLAQTLLRLTGAGVPDLYQGDEVWNLSLVDPDNRRPVDFRVRRALLAEAQDLEAEAVMARVPEGMPKVWLIERTLRFRARRPDLFGPNASYMPLHARGPRRDHLVAFVRGGRAIVAVPRLVLGLADEWEDTTLMLPPGQWVDLLGGRDWSGLVSVSHLLGRFPVALLEAQ